MNQQNDVKKATLDKCGLVLRLGNRGEASITTYAGNVARNHALRKMVSVQHFFFLFPKGDVYFSPGLPEATLGHGKSILHSPEGIVKTIPECIFRRTPIRDILTMNT